MLLIYGLRGNLTMQRRQKGLKNKQLYILITILVEWGAPDWRALLQGKEFTDDDGVSVRRVTSTADVVFSHEDDVHYARYVIKGEKDIKKSHDYTILRQVFDMARDHGGDDWVEDKFYKGKKIEQVGQSNQIMQVQEHHHLREPTII